MLKTLKDFNFKNKRVLVRCDFNVPFTRPTFAPQKLGGRGNKGNISDDFRIKQALPTIEYLLKQDAKIILLSHLGRPRCLRPDLGDLKSDVGASLTSDFERSGLKQFTLKPVALCLEQLLKTLNKPLTKPLKIQFLENCLGEQVEKAIAKLKPGGIVLLENLRFYKGEQENDLEFASQLAALGDIYINDAFSVCHRAHASIVGLPQLLPCGAGLLLQQEHKVLSQITERPRRPLVVIIGGVKLATKIKLIEGFLERADHLLLGGKIANALCLNSEFKHNTNPKLHMPLDGLIALKTLAEGYLRTGALASVRKEESIFDIGPETIKIFSEIISRAKTILWSGPLGYIEDERFVQGSLAIAQAIIMSKVFSIVGGGETNAFLAQHNLRRHFSHVSTAGGAMLTFLSGETLPGLEALKE